MQDLGHKFPGSVGLDAGAQPAPGYYFGDRVLSYWSNRLLDQNANPLPVVFDLDAFANALGATAVVGLLPRLTVGATIAVPYADVLLRGEEPLNSLLAKMHARTVLAAPGRTGSSPPRSRPPRPVA